MTVLNTPKFVAFNPLQNNNTIADRHHKLIAKIDKQIQLAANKDYTSTQQKWVADEHGTQPKVEVADVLAKVCEAAENGELMRS